MKITGERLDAYAKARGTSNCKKRLLEAMRHDVEKYTEMWDIDIGVASSYPNIDEAAIDTFPQYHISNSPLTFSISSHVGPNAFGMAVSRRLARSKGEL